MRISNIQSSSGKCYRLGFMAEGEYQYEDRDYQFNYVPKELDGYVHIKTHGDDKLICEDDECFSFTCNEDVYVYIIFADKHPLLPNWLASFQDLRMNVTRYDSNSVNLKGYFRVYKKLYEKGRIVLNGCSPKSMLQKDWYMATKGENYCMYSVCVKPV